MNLEQKMLELRKAILDVQKQKHSPNVTYKYATLYDVLKFIVPKMDEIGVNFRITKEANARIEQIMTQTRNGERLMWMYQSDITTQWTDTENPEDKIISETHCIAWNDDPAKAKGAAFTYALKYDYFSTFSVDMSEDDPDGKNYDAAPYKKPQPVAAEQPEPQPTPILCEDCGQAIKGGRTQNGTITAEEYAVKTKEKYGKCLCAACVKSQ